MIPHAQCLASSCSPPAVHSAQIAHQQLLHCSISRRPQHISSTAVTLSSKLEQLHLDKVPGALGPFWRRVAHAAPHNADLCSLAGGLSLPWLNQSTCYACDVCCQTQTAQETIQWCSLLAVAIEDDQVVLGARDGDVQVLQLLAQQAASSNKQQRC